MFSGPTIKYPRSAFKQNPSAVTSWKHGEIVPIQSFFVLPGTTIKYNLGSLIRLNTPIAPFTGRIEAEVNAFFVPLRLLWSSWKKMFGENENAAGVPTETEITLLNNHSCDLFWQGVKWDSIGAYCNKPVVAKDNSGVKHALATLWKEKAYFKIWNEHYRHTMIQNPVILSDQPSDLGSWNGTNINLNASLMKVNKTIDTFTGALQSPQFGSAVLLPLGSSAPVYFDLQSGTGHQLGPVNITSDNVPLDKPSTYRDTINVWDPDSPGDLGSYFTAIADLSSATSATVNSIRYAFASQKYQELSQFGGAVYWGQLVAHYGVTPSDASLQRSQRLGTIDFDLNVSQVTAMADSATRPTGSVGAISVTGNNRHLFTKAFEEFGVVMVLLHTRVKHQLYQQGIKREDTRLKRIDWYDPCFANVGDFVVKKKEIFVTGDATDEEAFGYNEAWYDERYLNSSATGVCNAQAGAGVAVDIWSLATNFGSRPTLDSSFIAEDRDLVASRLVTGTSSNYDYIGEFAIDIQKISEVPLHSLPGKIDHVGNM